MPCGSSIATRRSLTQLSALPRAVGGAPQRAVALSAERGPAGSQDPNPWKSLRVIVWTGRPTLSYALDNVRSNGTHDGAPGGGLRAGGVLRWR